MPGSSRRTRSDRSSALRCPSWRTKMFRTRSRLFERLPPIGRRVARSGRERAIEIGELATSSPTHQRLLYAKRLAATAGRGRVRVLDREAAAGDGVDEVDLGALQVPHADRVDKELDSV